MSLNWRSAARQNAMLAASARFDYPEIIFPRRCAEGRARAMGNEETTAVRSEAGSVRIDLASQPQFCLGELRFDPATRQLFSGGEAETLEPRVMQVLVLLASRKGQVVSRDELVERCWDGRAVSEDAINRSIAKVRRLSETHGAFDLETIPRVGYRLAERGAAAPMGRRLLPWLAAAAAVLLVVAAALWLTVLRPESRPAEPVSLAVLPFRNLSTGDPYFAEGIAEEILTRLAAQPGLRVAGRTSSWLFRDQADPKDVGRRLSVAYLLEGSVRRAGNRVRVDVALVGTRDGMRRWSQTFEGNLDDIFAIQAQIGNAVASELREEIVVTAPSGEALQTSGDVYNLYLIARGQLRTREPARIETAIELLRAAVRLDRDYAPAWAALGAGLVLADQAGGLVPGTPEERLIEARRSIERALQLSPELPEALIPLAGLEDGDDLRQRLERAVQREPGNAELWYALARLRSAAFDFDGELEALRRTAQIDPFWIRSTSYPAVAWQLGARSEAEAFEQRLIQTHPEALRRLTASMRLAVYRRDWSEAYRLSRAVDRMRPADVRALESPPNANPIFLRVRIGRMEEARSLLMVPWAIDDSAPSVASVLAVTGDARTFWSFEPLVDIVVLRMNQHGRSADLLRLYDAAFASPEEMSRIDNFLLVAPGVAAAMRAVGRSQEAERLTALAAERLAPALQQRRTPFWMLEVAARIRALEGRREEALNLLERAVAMGWQWEQFGLAPSLADELSYASIADDPRFRRIDARIQADVARERRETAALGL